MVALNSQRQDSTLYSWSCTIIGALWFSSKYKVYKKCLLLLFIPVGHHALKSSLLTLYLAGSEHSKYSCYGLLSLVLFFLRKAKKPIYVKTRKGHFWLTTHFFLVSCKGHLSCLSIRTWFCGLHSSHANPVVLGRRGSLFFFSPYAKSLCYLNFIYLKELPLSCTGFSQRGILGNEISLC